MEKNTTVTARLKIALHKYGTFDRVWERFDSDIQKESEIFYNIRADYGVCDGKRYYLFWRKDVKRIRSRLRTHLFGLAYAVWLRDAHRRQGIWRRSACGALRRNSGRQRHGYVQQGFKEGAGVLKYNHGYKHQRRLEWQRTGPFDKLQRNSGR